MQRYRFSLSKTKSQTHNGRMMPFKTQNLEPLKAVLNVRLTEAEKSRLKDDADLAALSMSELVRRMYFGRTTISSTNAMMIKEMRRIGCLLKHMHNESSGGYSRDTAEALSALKTHLRKLSHDRQEG